MPVEKTTVPGDDAESDPTLRKLHDLGRTVSSADEDIRGRMVKDKDGQNVGTIDGLLVDAAARKVRFMEVASGGFLGLGETKSLIPVEAITRITEHDVYIGHTREHVAGAPPYDPELVKEDAGYFSGLYPYYGYQGGVVPLLIGYPHAKRDEAPPEVGWPHHA
ncbi:MAG: PRC-barrel domain-containing protein [Candidatus Limnocylindrales bacterium]